MGASSYRCVGEIRKLAAGGGHSAVLTDACSLKELCEFRLAEGVTLSNASKIGDVASRTGSDALARLCERIRYFFPVRLPDIKILYNCDYSKLFCVKKISLIFFAVARIEIIVSTFKFVITYASSAGQLLN